MKGFNLKKLNEVQSKKQYQVKISNRFAADDDRDINRVWETSARISKYQPTRV
jgi:hypothetical protein